MVYNCMPKHAASEKNRLQLTGEQFRQFFDCNRAFAVPAERQNNAQQFNPQTPFQVKGFDGLFLLKKFRSPWKTTIFICPLISSSAADALTSCLLFCPPKAAASCLRWAGGSIRRIGLYDKLRELLSDYEVFDFSGIEPNPKISTIRRAVELCKAQKIDFIVAAGGGSVIDAVKCIAAGAYYDGDPWDLVLDHSRIGRAIPFCAVLTLSATGSDYDNSGVISNSATNEKMFLAASNLFPQASILDPTYTFTVPANQTAAGSADIISHTFEQYLVKEGNPFTDAMCEGVLRTVFEYAPKAIAAPDDYEARAQLMMVSSFGCCGLLSIGRTPSPWPCHGMEHEISAFYDITHGVGLAILTPNWMRWSLTPETAPRFAQYGVRVWHLNPQDDVMTNAQKAIEKTAEFFKSIGLPSKLSEVGIDDKHFEEMADHVAKIWWSFDGALRPISRSGVLEILRMSL